MIPFKEIPENIDITKAPQPKYYDGDEYPPKGWYAFDIKENRWELLDLKPFGYIEGVKEGDWKVKRENGRNTYYEWEAGAYTADGQLNPNNYPKWVKKTIAQWKARTGNLWKLCSNFMTLYNVPKPSTGVDETCVIYYISNENDNDNDKDNPIDTLRGAIWKWDEENVRWLPQNLGTALNYTEPTNNKYWDPNNWNNSTKKLDILIDPSDIPSGGKWATILQADVDNALDSYCLNDINPGPYKYYYSLSWTSISSVNPLLRIVPSIKKKYQYGSPPSVSITSITRDYDNLSQNNFDEEQKRLAKKLFEGRR